MDLKRLLVLTFLGAVACGGGRHTAPPPEPELVTELNALQPEAAAEEPAPSACADEDCPELTLFQMRVPGCCRGSAGCGGRLRISPSSTVCLPPGYDVGAYALGAAITRHAGTPIEPDPGCPSQDVDGNVLPGCCDPSGHCGLDTSEWSRELQNLGIKLPAVCLPPGEIAALAGTPAPDAGLAQACGVGGG